MSPYLATATNGTFLTEQYDGQRRVHVRRGRPQHARRRRPIRRTRRSHSRYSIPSRRSWPSSPTSTGATRSAQAAASSTGLPTWATRSSPRPAPTTSASPTLRPWCTRSPTSGSATRSRSPCGPTSGSTRASRRSRSGSTTSVTAGPRRRRPSMSCARSPEEGEEGAGPVVPGAGRARGRRASSSAPRCTAAEP